MVCSMDKEYQSRNLAGKPLAGFRATPSRRMPVLYDMMVHAIRITPPIASISDVKKTMAWGESGFPVTFPGLPRTR